VGQPDRCAHASCPGAACAREADGARDGAPAFDLRVEGDVEISTTLISQLQSAFSARCDADELLADAEVDTRAKLESLFERLQASVGDVPGFRVQYKVVLGIFEYGKLPMVRDLESSVAALAEHELIAALADDAGAQQTIRDRRADVERSLPDRTPPQEEFLVCDADSSQNQAINRVLAGQDLVIKGPPGTGKSQTISNLIACLVASDKTVLFVAEKRAAIDAVLKRLERVGLHDLVLDLHGATSRRQVAQSLARTMETNAEIPRQDLDQEHRRLEARRRELSVWAEALHEKREPWGVSLFDARARLLAAGEEVTTDVRIRDAQLRDLTASTLERAREDLREFVRLGGLHATSSSPWAGAPITSKEQGKRARDVVDDLATRRLDPLLDALERASAHHGLTAVATMGDWAARLALWTEIRATLDLFEVRSSTSHWRPWPSSWRRWGRVRALGCRRASGTPSFAQLVGAPRCCSVTGSSSAGRVCCTACAPRSTSGPPGGRR
jgi:hypothetical protein